MDYKTIDYSKIVSPIALEFLLGGCESLMDTLPELYPDFNVNDESAVKKLIRGEYPAEDFSEQTAYTCYVFNSFCYFLTKDNIEFGGLFESCSYLPFETPENPRQFFIWMFEEIFHGKSWKMENPEDYTITTNHLINAIIESNDSRAYANSINFGEKVSLYDFESKFKFK